ncbi:MAG: hypothetical protein Q9224_000473 [Gallowayella concinna]
MGGIVAAEALVHIISDEPISPSKPVPVNPCPSSATHTTLSPTSTSAPSWGDSHSAIDEHPRAFMFPYIQGILAFDTPYLGLSPSLIAHGAESHYRSASSAYSAVSELAGAFGYGGSITMPQHHKPRPKAALAPSPEHAKDVLTASMTASSDDAAAAPPWQRLGKYAMFAGAAGAVVAGGTAAYFKKDALSSGWNWVGSHLEFVGCLVRGEELKRRLEKVVSLDTERGLGFANLFTVLGRGANGGGGSGAGAEQARTFCNVPKSKLNRAYWFAEVNDKSKEETEAHMSMFLPKENPGYYAMGERAKGLVVGWVERGGWDPLTQDGEEDEISYELNLDDVDMDKETGMDFGVEKEEGVLWGDEHIQKDNPWKMEGEKGLEGIESVIIEKQ